MAGSLRKGETMIRRYWETAACRGGKVSISASPRHPFPVSQKVWYDQAVTRMGGE